MARNKWLSVIKKKLINMGMMKNNSQIFQSGDSSQRKLKLDGFSLMITMYDEEHPLRRDEMTACFERNLNHPLINEIYVFFERKEGVCGELYKYVTAKKNNVEIIDIFERPTFRTFFDYANSKLKEKKVIIANTDIFFDKTLFKIENYDFNRKFFVFTRWNLADDNKLYLQTKKNPTYPWKKIKKEEFMDTPSLQNTKSADAWIFKPPLEMDFDCHYEIGTFRSDTLLNFSLLQKQSLGSFKVFNPCLSIKVCHMDKNIGNKSLEEYLKNFEENFPAELLVKCKSASIKWCTIEDTYK
jgi:hypothetical protein